MTNNFKASWHLSATSGNNGPSSAFFRPASSILSSQIVEIPNTKHTSPHIQSQPKGNTQMPISTSARRVDPMPTRRWRWWWRWRWRPNSRRCGCHLVATAQVTWFSIRSLNDVAINASSVADAADFVTSLERSFFALQLHLLPDVQVALSMALSMSALGFLSVPKCTNFNDSRTLCSWWRKADLLLQYTHKLYSIGCTCLVFSVYLFKGPSAQFLSQSSWPAISINKLWPALWTSV